MRGSPIVFGEGAVQCMRCSVHLDQQRGRASERVDQDEEGGEEQRSGQDHLVHARHVFVCCG